MKQTILPIGTDARRSLGNFFEHSGSGHIKESLIRYISGEGMHHLSSLFICGQSGVGKSHLLEGAYYYCREHAIDAMRFTVDNQDTVANRADFSQDTPIVLLFDDVDTLIENDSWCASLMSWLDWANDKKANVRFVFAADVPPPLLSANRPDIVSRLANSVVWTIEAPHENDLLDIMQRYVAHLGFALNDRSYQYMLERCPREINTLINILDEVSELSLIENRKAGFSMVSRVVRNRNIG